jgi:hypothetical protein
MHFHPPAENPIEVRKRSPLIGSTRREGPFPEKGPLSSRRRAAGGLAARPIGPPEIPIGSMGFGTGTLDPAVVASHGALAA